MSDHVQFEPCVKSFAADLAERGYAPSTLRWKQGLVETFVRWAAQRHVQAAAVTAATVEEFLVSPDRRWRAIGNRRFTLVTFIEHLRESGASGRPPPVVPDRSQEALLLRRFEAYLRLERGLAAGTVRNTLLSAREFIGAISEPEGLADTVTADSIRRYLLDQTRSRSPATMVRIAGGLRSLLRFLFVENEVPTDLSSAVPTVRRWRRASVHPYLSPDEVERLLATCDRTRAAGRRDHALLLLLARLGIRACEVAALELGDLRWRSAEIVVRGKGRARDRLPMIPQVGAALALYLRDGRPASTCRRVLLRNIAPRVGLGADAIGLVVRRALVRADLRPPRRGSHLLRHSLATTMIRQGATMAEIGGVLRHHSVETTEIYAKVDFAALRSVALPWIGEGGAL